ncbi:hypothetical protein [Palleronia sp. LCG004]|uniref:hypothetical protein n=1 Tax=Palleronia sp. LCG004 TaxID=3079304 RepID=UPI0029425153|nr:hypothetical protein [Palleronia sp. LCG004]WOI57769.1 hypothetical protein RVY76_16110 [Palleronia sp. LCG004]
MIDRLPDFLEIRRRGWTGPPADLSAWRATLPPHDGLPEVRRRGIRVAFRFATGARATGVFLRGERPGPAILALHEHGGDFVRGWGKLARPSAHYHGLAPLRAIRAAGLSVLCLDAVGFGARWSGGYEAQQALAAGAMGLGWSLAGITAAEDMQAARWLASLDGVTSVGAFGFSFGGFRAWQVLALSKAVSAAASIGWMACRADMLAAGSPFLRGQSAFHFLHPGIAADYPDLAAAAAPKPLFLRVGRGDRHMPEASAARAFARIASLHPTVDAGFHDERHTCPRDVLTASIDFLRDRLA